MPSTAVVIDFVSSLLDTEDKLLSCLSLILNRHPAIVNASVGGGSGQSLLQHLVRNCNFSSVLELMLDAQVPIGMQEDLSSRTALNTAIDLGRWRSLRLLLDAVIDQNFMMVPRAMTCMTFAFEAMARKFPREFLHFVKNMPMQAAATRPRQVPVWNATASSPPPPPSYPHPQPQPWHQPYFELQPQSHSAPSPQ